MSILSEVYVRRDSLFHRLDPRIRFVWFACFILFIGVFNHPIPQFIIFIAIMIIGLGLAKLGSPLLKVMTYFVTIVIVSMLMWPLFIRTGAVILTVRPWYVITTNGLYTGIGQSMRWLNAGIVGAIFIMTTKQRELITCFRDFKLPEPIIHTIVIQIRFLPSIAGEWKAIMEAQQIRGQGIRGGITGRLKRFGWAIPMILIPVGARVMKMASNLALALDSMGFEANERPPLYKTLPLKRSEKTLIAFFITATIVIIGFRLVTGYGWIPLY